MLPIFFEVEYIIDAIYLRAEKKKIPNFARYQNFEILFFSPLVILLQDIILPLEFILL